MLPKHSSKALDKYFWVQGVPLWKDLPEGTRRVQTVYKFKQLVKEQHIIYKLM